MLYIMPMKRIPLTQGKIAIVDDADFEWLNQWKWHTLWNGYSYYAAHWESRTGKYKRKTQLMHRVILGLERDNKHQCDHIDGDGLNNQRANLRVCTPTQNQQNMRKRSVRATSRYKGVRYNKPYQKWVATIHIKGKPKQLGVFRLETTAALAYNEAALKYFGEFARLNVI